MKIKLNLAAVGLIALTWVAEAAPAPASLSSIPAEINYQGRLMVPNGTTPYNDATHTIDLTLYRTAVSPTKLWSERYSVQTKDGYFSVNLGSGGTGLLSSNLPLWQVLWKDNADASSPDTYFMALTVRTDPSGNDLPTPVESTPRQQFLTAPFAYRAHQSVYSSKADGVFSAGGINTTNLSATNINAATLSAPTVTTTTLSAGSINTTGLSANNINTTTLAVGGKPMFVTQTNRQTYLANVSSVTVFHTISTTDYDVFIVGTHMGNQRILDAWMLPDSTSATVRFAPFPTVGGDVTLRFLGIRKGLTQVSN